MKRSQNSTSSDDSTDGVPLMQQYKKSKQEEPSTDDSSDSIDDVPLMQTSLMRQRPPIFRYEEICSELNTIYSLDDLKDMAKTMGVPAPDTMTKQQICNTLTPLTTDLINKRVKCTNFKGENLSGEPLKNIPPYLIYTFTIDVLDDDNKPPNSVRNATVCVDLRDLIQYIDTNASKLNLSLWHYPKIPITSLTRRDIHKRWDLLTNYAKNGGVEENLPIVPLVIPLKQLVTDLFIQLHHPRISIDEFLESTPSKLISYLQSASHYHALDISEEEVDQFRQNADVRHFVQFILRKAANIELRNTLMMALCAIINEEDLGDINIPSPPSSAGSHSSDASSIAISYTPTAHILTTPTYYPSLEDTVEEAFAKVQELNKLLRDWQRVYVLGTGNTYTSSVHYMDDSKRCAEKLNYIITEYKLWCENRNDTRVQADRLRQYINHVDCVRFFLRTKFQFRNMNFLFFVLPQTDDSIDISNLHRITMLLSMAQTIPDGTADRNNRLYTTRQYIFNLIHLNDGFTSEQKRMYEDILT